MDAPILRVLLHYFPDWDPPPDRREWNACLCPAHSEDRPSAAVSYENGGVKCQACGFKGDVISIIMGKEKIPYGEAVRRAESILGGSYDPVSKKPPRKSGRRVFGVPGVSSSGRRSVPPWVRE